MATFIRELQAVWPTGELERLATFYHPEVVLLPPDLGVPIRGREAVIDSYREFLSAATLEEFTVTDLSVFAFDEASVHMAHLRFEIAYTLDQQRYREEGLEIYAVTASADGLAIVWRAQSVLDTRLL